VLVTSTCASENGTPDASVGADGGAAADVAVDAPITIDAQLADRPSLDGTASDATDGSSDAAPCAPTDPCWVHFPDAPPECVLDIATQPWNVTPTLPLPPGPVPFMSCGPGCRRTASGFYNGTDAFRLARGRDIVLLGGDAPPIADHLWVIMRTVVDLDRGTVAAIRFTVDFTSNLSCSTDHFGGWGTEIAWELDYNRGDGVGTLESWVRLYRAQYDSASATVQRAGEWVSTAPDLAHPGYVLGGGVVGSVELGSGFASFRRNAVFVTQPDGTINNVTAPMHILSARPFHVGRDVIFDGVAIDPVTRMAGPGVLAESIRGADATILRTAPTGNIGNFGSDGTTLAWLESTGPCDATGHCPGLGLWTGTYDDTSQTLTATRVRDMPLYTLDSAVGGGWYVQQEMDTTSGHAVYAIYRLSDGARAVFAPVVDGTQVDAAGIDIVAADELVFDTPEILWRIDPTTLTFT
jgi:hypothetical protein